MHLRLGERTADASGRGFKASGDFVILSKQLKDITITSDGTRRAEEELRKSACVTGLHDPAPIGLAGHHLLAYFAWLVALQAVRGHTGVDWAHMSGPGTRVRYLLRPCCIQAALHASLC